MFTFDTSDAQRVAVSALGAVALAAICIGAAVAPVRAATPIIASAGDWQAAVERRLDTVADDFSLGMIPNKRAEAVLAVHFTPDGAYDRADIVRSTGNAALDRHALKVAARLDYPQLPVALRGKPVAMRLLFGRADTAADYAAMKASAKRAPLAAGSLIAVQ